MYVSALCENGTLNKQCGEGEYTGFRGRKSDIDREKSIVCKNEGAKLHILHHRKKSHRNYYVLSYL